MSVLCVHQAFDLANLWTDMVLIYGASNSNSESFKLFYAIIHAPFKNINYLFKEDDIISCWFSRTNIFIHPVKLSRFWTKVNHT